MGRLVMVALVLSALGAIAYKVMYRSAPAPADSTEQSAPKRQLENVRGAANRIERDQQQAADDVEKKAFGAE